MKECNVCNIEEIYQVDDIDDFYWFLMESLDEFNEISVFTDYETTKDLMWFIMQGENVRLGLIDINTLDYDGEYILSLQLHKGGAIELNVDQAKIDDNYLTSGALTFVDYNVPTKCDYINKVSINPSVEKGFRFFVIGEISDKDKVYEFEKHYEDDNYFTDISITSNVKEYVDIVKSMFDDFFE